MRNIYTSENYTLAYHVSMYTEREYTGRPPSALYLVYFYIGLRGDLPPPPPSSNCLRPGSTCTLVRMCKPTLWHFLYCVHVQCAWCFVYVYTCRCIAPHDP